LYLDEDNILYLTVVGDLDEKIAIAHNEAVSKFENMVEGKLKMLADLTKAGKPSTDARKLFKEFTEREKIGRFALFGVHQVAKIIASFFMGISRKKDMRFFKTEEEALIWLIE